MAEEQQAQSYPCPSCGKTVSIQDLKCEFCGVDLKSGESFQTQVGRKKSKARHSEHFADTVLIGVIMVFALIITGGFLYQRRVSNMLAGPSGQDALPGVRPTILALDLLDQLILIVNSDHTAADKAALADSRVSQEAYDPVFMETFDLRSAMRPEKLRDGDWGEGERDPAKYALTLAEKISADLRELDRSVERLDQGNYADDPAARHYTKTFGEDFDFGAYRRLLRSLQARLALRIDKLQASSAGPTS